MRQRSVHLLLPAALLLLLGACISSDGSGRPLSQATGPRGAASSSPEAAEAAADTGPQRMLDLYDPLGENPWTDAFQERSILVADHVRVEGPPGLITRCVVQQDPERFRFETEATSRGLLQRTIRRLDDPRDVGIRVQLDGMQIMAMGKVEVLERPDPVAVTVVASGEAWWREPSGSEKRGESLRFEGPLVTPAPGGGSQEP